MPDEDRAAALEKLVDQLTEGLKKQQMRTSKLRKMVAGKMPKKYKLQMEKLLKENLEPFKNDIGTLDQTIKRFERQLEILQKEIGQLRKEALTEADIKPFKKLL